MENYEENKSNDLSPRDSSVSGDISPRDSSVLDATFENVLWRTKVSETLVELEERIMRLEKKESIIDGHPRSTFGEHGRTSVGHRRSSFCRHPERTFGGHPRRTFAEQSSLSIIQHDIHACRRASSFSTYQTFGLDGVSTGMHLIFTKRYALLQCFWLFVCLALFTYAGVHQFVRAWSSENSEWKPEKISHVNNYASGMQYEMPNIYILYQVSSLNPRTEVSYNTIYTAMENMIVSQKYFESSSGIVYQTPELETVIDSLSCEEAENSFLSWVSNDTFLGFFKIRLSNPNPEFGYFWFWILLATDNLTLTDTFNINGFWVHIGRDMSRISLNNLLYLSDYDALNDGATFSYTVDYKETIHFAWKSSKPSYRFETDMAWKTDRAEAWVKDNRTGLYITFRGNELVETWKEYVDFSHYDWISSMGGYLQIFSICFFFVAYQIAKVFGDNNMLGLLPALSKTFRNLEMLSLIKIQLEDKEILLFDKKVEEH